MEVHHHAHTSRKKWTHYFWEFLMLFLAVTLGFFVENQREHYVEHKRAKIYAVNFYNDLKKDTANLTWFIEWYRLTAKKMDTLSLFIKERNSRKFTSGLLYYYASYVTGVFYFSSHNATIEQLKGSGNLRLMEKEISYKISEYDNKLHSLEKEYGLSKSEFSKIEDLHFKVFDMYTLQTFFPRMDKSRKDSVARLNTLYVTQDKGLLNEYAGWIKFEVNVYNFQLDYHLIPIRKMAEKLLDLLKENYSIEK